MKRVVDIIGEVFGIILFSELDNLRKRQLIEKLPNDMQIFITTTERLNMHWNREVRFYDIEQGRIKEVYK